MNLEQILSTVWRRKVLFLAVLILGVAAIAAITYSLPKTYRATATMFVGVNKQANEALAFDTALGEQLVRTYTALAANPNTADAVAAELDPRPSKEALLARMSFAPVERTQLLEISADADSREEAETIANTYADTFKERVDEQLAAGETQTELAVSEPASAPKNPIRPKPALYLGVGAMLAWILALGVVLLRERLADPLLVDEEESTVLGLPVLARIPQVDWRRPAERGLATDALELLRVNVDFASEGRGEVLLISSARPREGKSSLSIELASRCAAHGEIVVVIEADLRRPGITSTAMGSQLAHARIGLSNYLARGAKADEVISERALNGVRMIWSGPLPPNPSALLQSKAFAELMVDLRMRFDRIIIDTPPISVGADVSLLVPHADYILFVIDAPTARRSVAQIGLNQLSAAKSRHVGVVLNRVAHGVSGSYGYQTAHRPGVMAALTGSEPGDKPPPIASEPTAPAPAALVDGGATQRRGRRRNPKSKA